ncbi:MAG: OmpH family outer membrane protein [Rhodospirillales bacterium]|nr:OmpH family outer membrane protein [Rhodospirillales bacterium]
MKKYIALLVVLVGLSAFQAQAGEIGVVDADYLMNNSETGRDLKDRLDKYRFDLQNEFKSFQTKADQEVKKIKARNPSKEDYETQIKALKQKTESDLAKLNEKKLKLETAARISLQILRKEILDTVTMIAKQKGLQAVVTEQAVLFADDKLMITSDVMKEMNKNKKSIKMSYP